MTKEEFKIVCLDNEIILNDKQFEKLEQYHLGLKEWNSKVNLISRKEEDRIYDKHILHSLTILKYADIKDKKGKCLDVGTGGGLPGIPIGIAKPNLDMILIDSIAKKIKIAKELSEATGQKNFRSIRGRCETLEMDRQYFRAFNYVISRAVVKLDKLLEWTERINKLNARIIILKGGDLSEEIKEAKKHRPNLVVYEYDIDIKGADWFKNDDKKVLVCKLKNK